MSQSNQAKTKRSSQIPQSRAAPAGTEGTGNQNNQSYEQDDNQIPSEAVSSRERSSYQQQQGSRWKSNAQRAPDLSPDDSISRMRSQPGQPNSDRRGSQKSRTPWNEWGSPATRASSQNGTAWSGSGAALTENNLEKFNEANENQQSMSNANQAPRSDEQQVPQSAQQTSRQDGNTTKYRGTQANGTQKQSQAQARQGQGEYTWQRTSRQYRGTQPQRYTQAEGPSSHRGQTEGGGNNQSGPSGATGAAAVGGAAGESAASYSQSRRQSGATSRNAMDANFARPRSASQSQKSAATPSKNAIDNNVVPSRSKSMSQSQSRRDSKFEEDGYYAREVSNQPQGGQLSRVPSKPRSPQSSPTSPTSPTIPRGWEKKTRIITTRYPDGQEIREREVTLQPVDTRA